MGIALIVVGGLVLITLIGVIGDYYGKKKLALSAESLQRLETLEQQVQVLSTTVGERDERIARLEEGITFVNRLLEDKSKQ